MLEKICGQKDNFERFERIYWYHKQKVDSSKKTGLFLPLFLSLFYFVVWVMILYVVIFSGGWVEVVGVAMTLVLGSLIVLFVGRFWQERTKALSDKKEVETSLFQERWELLSQIRRDVDLYEQFSEEILKQYQIEREGVGKRLECLAKKFENLFPEKGND